MNILTIDYNDAEIGKKFTQSLHESGFAVIKNHPIDDKLINKVYNDWDILNIHTDTSASIGTAAPESVYGSFSIGLKY